MGTARKWKSENVKNGLMLVDHSCQPVMVAIGEQCTRCAEKSKWGRMFVDILLLGTRDRLSQHHVYTCACFVRKILCSSAMSSFGAAVAINCLWVGSHLDTQLLKYSDCYPGWHVNIDSSTTILATYCWITTAIQTWYPDYLPDPFALFPVGIWPAGVLTYSIQWSRTTLSWEFQEIIVPGDHRIYTEGTKYHFLPQGRSLSLEITADGSIPRMNYSPTPIPSFSNMEMGFENYNVSLTTKVCHSCSDVPGLAWAGLEWARACQNTSQALNWGLGLAWAWSGLSLGLVCKKWLNGPPPLTKYVILRYENLTSTLQLIRIGYQKLAISFVSLCIYSSSVSSSNQVYHLFIQGKAPLLSSTHPVRSASPWLIWKSLLLLFVRG